ncbi:MULTISPECIES: outer membrane beta-barrel protein, partial [unclassified Bradyrhizobium]
SAMVFGTDSARVGVSVWSAPTVLLRDNLRALGRGPRKYRDVLDAIWSSSFGSHDNRARRNRCNECGRPRARSETATGGYIGGHVGGGYGRTSFSNPYGPSIYGDVVDTPVFLAGGQIGYNWQKNGWVFGVELDASGAVSDGTNTCLAASGFIVSANCKAGPNVFATGTGRVGYAFGALGHTPAYLKGGVAWQNNRGDVVNNFEGGSPQEKAHFDYGRLGATIGLGVEQALTPAWSVKAEYDYLHFGGPSVATPPTEQNPPFAILPANTTGLSSNYHIGKIGLNYLLAPTHGRRNGRMRRCTRKHPPVRRSGVAGVGRRLVGSFPCQR